VLCAGERRTEKPDAKGGIPSAGIDFLRLWPELRGAVNKREFLRENLQPSFPRIMKTFLRILTASATVLAIMTTTVFAANPAGYVDFGSFSPEAGEEYVEVNLSPAMLQLSASLVQKNEPGLADILRNLERVRVNVFSVTDANRSETTDRIGVIRSELDAQGWTRLVTVQESQGDNVAVFVKQADDETLQGVVVTVIGGNGEAVLVNVVGEVTLEQIVRLGEQLDIDPLCELKFES
jgi:hypothetical protein